MTPTHALQVVRRLLALAAPNSGTTQEESRSAAVKAAHLIVEHQLLDRPRHAVDLAVVTRLSLRLLELERLLAEERAARVSDARRRDTVPRRRRA